MTKRTLVFNSRDQIIEKTGEIFKETYTFIKDFSEFKYANKSEKLDNIRKAKHFEESCNKSKEKFDDVVKKIQRQDIALIESARSSFRLSRLSTKKGDDTTSQQTTNNQQMNVFFMNGKEYLDGEIQDREKQIKLISK